jgi:Mrr N-terminal domain
VPPSIDIDNEVFEVLKTNAEPFTDTPNTVLRRLLSIDPDKRPPTPAGSGNFEEQVRAVPGTLVPEREYELPILRFLDEHDGRAPSREVVEAVGEELAGKLTEFDKRPLPSGGIRWQKRAAFVRLRLIHRGELVQDSPRGTWEISDRGRERLRSR